jgi:hypothetical protein
VKRFGRDDAVILLAMRESILETLSFLEREIDNSDGPDERISSRGRAHAFDRAGAR